MAVIFVLFSLPLILVVILVFNGLDNDRMYNFREHSIKFQITVY